MNFSETISELLNFVFKINFLKIISAK